MHARLKLLGIVLIIALIFSPASLVLGADVDGASDHPMISRYEGSEIIDYFQREFDDYDLLVKQVETSGGLSNNPDAVLPLEGKLTRIMYRNPAERGTLEVLRNYEMALQGAGFETIFACTNDDCGGRNFNHAVYEGFMTGIDEAQADQRYLAAKLSSADGDVYVGLYVAMANVGGGPNYQRAMTQLNVVELAPMQENMVVVDADAMAKGILEEGHIALYGILFDFNKATIRPDSKDTLDQVAKLLTESPDLKLVIVGHTDNVGSMEFNMDLSTRRAKAVKDALIADYTIAADRLQSWGAGFLAPIASNKTEAGQAKNRRVELVEQ